MEDKPRHSGRLSNRQETSFTDKRDEELPAFRNSRGSTQPEQTHELQKMVDKLLLMGAILAIALFITVSLLIFGATVDTLRLLFSGIIESIISILLIFIFRHQLFGSSEKVSLQKDELEEIGKVVDSELEQISTEQGAAKAELMNLVKQLKKQEKEIASIKKLVEQIEDHLNLIHSK